MIRKSISILLIGSVFLPCFILIGCQQPLAETQTEPETMNTDTTVGELSALIQFHAVPVRGFGIVAGLNGTGSAECPPALRRELEKYIRQQIPGSTVINPRQFLESPDTAVVEITGMIPALANPGDTFDVQIRPLSRTQTTSLNGGYLYTAPLKEMSRMVRYDQYSKTLAVADGQIFRDPFAEENDPLQWYLLGGGIVRNEVKISLSLYEPSFLAANAIRNRINERFGSKTAEALSSGEIRLSIPARYQNEKIRFLQLVQSLYLSEDPGLLAPRILTMVQQLQTQPAGSQAEVALEAIGNTSLDALAPLLQSSDDHIRFVAARCMLRIGDPRPLPILMEFCKNPGPYRIQAVRALGRNASRKEAESVLIALLSEPDITLRIEAYEQLLNLKSFVITRDVVAQNFLVDRVFCSGPKSLYVFRKNEPRIILFGSPISCKPNVFLQSDDQNVLINARPDDRFLSVSRKHPYRHRTIGPIPAGRDMASLIRTLGENAEVPKGKAVQPGLSIPYCQILKILKKMADHQIVPAEFYAGPVVQMEPFLQTNP